jgi:hypothetical protein
MSSFENSNGVTARGIRNDRGLNTYPHQFFDPSTSYIPHSVKELFRWCQFLYMTHSEIAPVINKKCAYVITRLIYDSDSDANTDAWRDVLERNMKIREMEYKLLLDFEVYGNAFVSIHYPFERYLTCRSCQKSSPARNLTWTYKDHKFWSRCPACKHEGIFDPKDRKIRNRRRIRLIRWNPKFINIRYNPFTDDSVYIYRIPTWLRKKLTTSGENHSLVEGTPLVILEAVRQNRDVELDRDNVYHFKNASISLEDDAFGMPPMLAVFKDAWLFQTYRRAQEQIALEHILPLTLLSPTGGGSGTSPHMSMDLGDWADKMQLIFKKWRRDPNGLFTIPFAATIENVRGDAQALNVHNDMTQIRQQITGGLDVPQEFIYGGLNWSGSSISLRVLENLFISRKEQLDDFLGWVVERVQRFCRLPNMYARHRDFKMADDAQQKQIALSLRQTNTISDQSTVEELGFDYERELKRRNKEEGERLAVMERSQLRQAELQGKVMVAQAEAQANAEAAAMKKQEEQKARGIQEGYDMGQAAEQAAAEAAMAQDPNAQDPNAQDPAAGQDPQAQQAAPADAAQMDPVMLDMMANHIIKGTPPHLIEMELQGLESSNPALAKAVRARLRTMQQQTASLNPLPEQKPPRRANAPV